MSHVHTLKDFNCYIIFFSFMTKGAALLPRNIALLQDLIKRDPESYVDEFQLQHQHYISLRAIFMADPRSGQGVEELTELIGFITHMTSYFPQETEEFPQEICELLRNNYDGLHPQLVEKLVHCVFMLRNKRKLRNELFIHTLMPVLLNTNSKQLRSQCYASLIQMVQVCNENCRDNKLNRMMQAQMFNILQDSQSNGLWATKITRELWRRRIWEDTRTVEIMKQAALNSQNKVAISGIRFFLYADKEREEDLTNEENNELDLAAFKHKIKVQKKTRKKAKQLEDAIKHAKKKQTGIGQDATHLNFSAIHLLNDPQGFVEKLYSTRLSNKGSNGEHGTKFTLEQTIECVNLVSRLVGAHKLNLIGLYSYLMRFLTPRQREATQFLAAAAQATHDLVPPENIGNMVRKIADEFVTEASLPEVATAGLSTIREILVRAPLAIEEPLLHDLVQYKQSKASSVMMAARSLITLYREFDPAMLPVKDRGKAGSIAVRRGEIKKTRYGEQQTSVIEGLHLLGSWKETHHNDDSLDDLVVEDDTEGWISVMDSNDHNDNDDENTKYSNNDLSDMTSMRENDASNMSDISSRSEDRSTTAEIYDKGFKSAEEYFYSLAGKEILTAKDFAKLDELNAEAGIHRALGQTHEDAVDAQNLENIQKKKMTKEERLAHIQAGREDRNYGSRNAKFQNKHRSLTNEKKARNKNIMMTIHKPSVKRKARRSLRDKQKVLRAHVKHQKLQKSSK